MKRGVRWLIFLQDTNGVAIRSMVSALGVSATKNYVMNSITVPRKPKQSIGAITKLVNPKTGDVLTLNVEYNQLESLLRQCDSKDGIPQGDIADPQTGHSKFPGNCNTLIIEMNAYHKVLQATKGCVAEFVNPKYSNETKTSFKSPTRLESMMQDLPKSLPNEHKKAVGITQFPTWFASAPVKNNIIDAKATYEKIGDAMSASSGEAGMYRCYRELLKAANVEIGESKEKEKVFGGIPVEYGARVVLDSSFGATVKEIKSKIKGKVSITGESTLVIRGGQIEIHNLQLDGALIIKAKYNSKIVIKNLTVKNEGWCFAPIEGSDAIEDKTCLIRGYKLKQLQQYILEFSDGQEHVIDDKVK